MQAIVEALMARARTSAVLATVIAVCGAAVVSLVGQTAQRQGIRIVVIAGEDAVNIVQQKTAVAPIVEVRDDNDLPVAGILVTFTVRGKTAAFAGGAQSLSVTTDAAGRAVAAGLTPSSTGAVQISVTATARGQTAVATISQRNFATNAQAAEAGATTSAGVGGVGPSAGSGGGLSKPVIAVIAGAAAGGAIVAATSLRGNTAPALTAARATPNAALLGTDTPIRFSVNAADENNDALQYSWEFGDGGTSSEASPTHIYRSAGDFTARVSVSDGEETATATTSVRIRTLTGTWRADVQGLFTQLSITLTQSGSEVTGNVPGYLGNGISVGPSPIVGTIRPTSPPIVLINRPGQGTIDGRPIALVDLEFWLESTASVDTLNGTVDAAGETSGPRVPAVFVRQ